MQIMRKLPISQRYFILFSHLINYGLAYRDPGYPNRITCFTCSNSSSNRECDRQAVDRACRPGEDSCHTTHVMAVHVSSLATVSSELSRGTEQLITHSVRKRCSRLSECLTAGCHWVGQRKICQSCCAGSYCNEGVPWREEDVETPELTNRAAHSVTAAGRYFLIISLLILLRTT